MGLIKWNELANVDNIVLMAPSLKGLLILIDILVETIRNISSKINFKMHTYI